MQSAPVSLSDVLFAVKTHSGFHRDRCESGILALLATLKSTNSVCFCSLLPSFLQSSHNALPSFLLSSYLLPVPVIRHTWGPDAGDNLMMFSDIEDPAYGTVFQGVPNTAKGHCGKTMAIVNKMSTEEKWRGLSWLFIADDDTLLR